MLSPLPRTDRPLMVWPRGGDRRKCTGLRPVRAPDGLDETLKDAASSPGIRSSAKPVSSADTSLDRLRRGM